MDHKYRYRNEDDKHVVTIEDAKGVRVDEKILGSHKAAMQLRDDAQAEGVKSFADIGKAKAKATEPAGSRLIPARPPGEPATSGHAATARMAPAPLDRSAKRAPWGKSGAKKG